jgi:hypothetical protein
MVIVRYSGLSLVIAKLREKAKGFLMNLAKDLHLVRAKDSPKKTATNSRSVRATVIVRYSARVMAIAKLRG